MEQHCLATGGGMCERADPALAGSDAALGIGIEKNVVQRAAAFVDEPILQRDRPIVVRTRMTQKNVRPDKDAGEAGAAGPVGRKSCRHERSTRVSLQLPLAEDGTPLQTDAWPRHRQSLVAAARIAAGGLSRRRPNAPCSMPVMELILTTGCARCCWAESRVTFCGMQAAQPSSWLARKAFGSSLAIANYSSAKFIALFL